MLQRDQYQRLKDAFLEARDLALPQRRDYLARIGADEPNLRVELERLLSAHQAGTVAPDWETPLTTLGSSAAADLDSRPAAGPRPDVFPGYEIVRPLSEGGQGVVYEAIQLDTKRTVAIKVLREGAHASPAARARFDREIELAARLDHPNIVSVFHSGLSDGARFLVMDYIQGAPLDRYVREQQTTPEQTLRLFCAVCAAVQFAHQRGVIHRDLKPSNILVDADGRPRILDFGLAKLLGAEPGAHATQSRQVMGTLQYMSPEQARGSLDEVDTRTDIYALGVILYLLLTGRHPYPVEGKLIDVLRHISETPPEPLTATATSSSASGIVRRLGRSVGPGAIDADVQTIVLKALSKEPERRYQSAAELARDLQRYLAGEPIDARRDNFWYVLRKNVGRHRVAAGSAAAIALVVLGSCVALFFMHGRERQAHLQAAAEATRLNGRLVAEQHEQLLYFNYAKADLPALESLLGQAKRAGVDAGLIAHTRALALLGANQPARAAEALLDPSAPAPENAETLYLLAWALREDLREPQAAAEFERAERLGGPSSAAEWFLRGLAIRRTDPRAAIASLREAASLRGREGGVFPQALLHLARAFNQRMYAERTLEGFDESVEGLRHLIQYGQWGAYPHYLLSISHRLAAEIHESTNPQDSQAAELYQKALDWARLGGESDPSDVRSVSAEAECLESMQRFEDALAARTRVVDASSDPWRIYEARHYRWRLRYWVGDHQAALDDLQAIVELRRQGGALSAQERRLYAHVYPTLVLAAAGAHDAARERIRALLAAPEPAGGAAGPAAGAPDDPATFRPAAVDVVWTASVMRLIGAADDAARVLEAYRAACDYSDGTSAAPAESSVEDAWRRGLYAMCAGELSRDELREQALAEGAHAPATDRAVRHRLAEADFHAAALAWSREEQGVALDLLQAAYYAFDGEQEYTFHAKTVLVKAQLGPLAGS